MDYSHLGFQQFSLKASNLKYSADTIVASIRSASMKEKSGFVLNNLVTDFSMNPTGVSLENLSIKTPGSEIKRQAIISYPSLAALKNDPGKLGLDLDLKNSKIAMKDLLTFVPQLRNQTTSLSPDATIFVDATITGKVNDMNFHKLVLKGLSATDINANGVVNGLPDAEAFMQISTSINFKLPKATYLHSFHRTRCLIIFLFPTAVSANGKIKGGMKNLYANLSINSSSGNAAIDGTLQNITDKNKATYDVVLHTSNLQLGSIMQNPKLGPATGDFKVKGTGFDPQTANATFKSMISNITLNNYNYHNIQAHGSIANKNYRIDATVSDPNLAANVDANGNFSGKYPTLHLQSTIDSIKTLPLHLTKQKNIYHGDIAADFSNLDPDHLDGNLKVTHSILVTDSNRITIDSIGLTATNSGVNEQIRLKTNFLNASIDGQYKLTQLANVFQQSIDPYYSLLSERYSECCTL